MSFWKKHSDDALADESALPPLTVKTVRSFESRYGVKLPEPLIKLLKQQNGGTPADNGFKFDGEDYYVDSFYGLAGRKHFASIQPLSEWLDLQDDPELSTEIRDQIGKPKLVFPFADHGGHCKFALDYNQTSPKGVPRIIYFVIEGVLDQVATLTNSFEDFLNGHYLGEAAPSVNLGDIEKEKVLLRTKARAKDVQFENWICDRPKDLFIYSQSFSDGKTTLRRSKLLKKSLNPTFCEISKLDYLPKPTIYQLLVYGNRNSSWVSFDESEQGGTIWKNTKGEMAYDTIYSHDRKQLVQLRKRLCPSYREEPTLTPKQAMKAVEKMMQENMRILNDL